MLITPAFVRNINDEDNRIIRVSDTPEDYISIHGVEYLEELPEEGEEADWQQLSEKYLQKDTTTTLVWLGLNHQSNSGNFPDAVAYRVEGDEKEYAEAEILAIINDWEPSFSGYTYWDGHNWSFQYTSDERGGWVAVELELTEVASHSGGWKNTALYIGSQDEDTDYYLGTSRAGGEYITQVALTELVEGTDFNKEVKELLYEAANTHLAAQRSGKGLEQQETRNLFAERLSLAEVVACLNELGEVVSEEGLRADFVAHGTLL